MKVHFIAIGGSIMHNLAISLHKKGYEVTGSDDEVFDPAKRHLALYDLLPSKMGWDPERISPDMDAIIIGMHAKPDNPELKRANELNLPVYSFPEYFYNQSKDKKRIVVAGSHGKTIITSMIMHVMNEMEMDFDYLVGAPVQGFSESIRLTTNAPVAIIEGDEYLSSPMDSTPKFLHYKPQVAVLTGLSWDHMNVFPSYDDYKAQFIEFVESMLPNSKLIYFEEDEELKEIVKHARSTVKLIPYKTPDYQIKDGKLVLRTIFRNFPLEIFGKHNLSNIEAAHLICKEVGIDDMSFFQLISTFKGAGKRLELVTIDDETRIFKDFAHAPSKVKATLSGLKVQFEDQKLIGVIELHTFSSLNKEFLPHYKHSGDAADELIIYINPEAVKHKDLEPISEEEIKNAFEHPNIRIFEDSADLEQHLRKIPLTETTLVLMSSGDFNGIDISELASELVG